MTFIILKSDKTIKSYLERIDDVVLEDGETFKKVEEDFNAYAEHFVLSHNGVSCMTINTPVGADPVSIDVSAPGYSSVSVDLSGTAQMVPLTDGKGTITLPADTAGRFLIEPTDRTLFCAAGCGSLLVIVEACE